MHCGISNMEVYFLRAYLLYEGFSAFAAGLTNPAAFFS